MDPELTTLMEAAQYSVPDATKARSLATGLERLTAHHRDACPPYARMLTARGDQYHAGPVSSVPYLPVGVFKSLELRSVHEDEVFKVMTSSGTTGQMPSRIYLDVETARLQTRALSSIVTHYLGPKRRPMLIVDHPQIIADRQTFSARTAGVLGMMTFGRDHLFILDEHMRLDRDALRRWMQTHAGEDVLIFGFTFMVWQDLVEALRAEPVDLSGSTLVHSGGWKRLSDQAVTKDQFRSGLRDVLGIGQVRDFYGMVEQVGSVYFECAAGAFHAPNFADIVIRDPATWQPLEPGRPGVIEVVSLLPRSYPGHALLTEDLGVVLGVDDCDCGGQGRRFEVLGRVPRSEIRGCSDTQVRD